MELDGRVRRKGEDIKRRGEGRKELRTTDDGWRLRCGARMARRDDRCRIVCVCLQPNKNTQLPHLVFRSTLTDLVANDAQHSRHIFKEQRQLSVVAKKTSEDREGATCRYCAKPNPFAGDPCHFAADTRSSSSTNPGPGVLSPVLMRLLARQRPRSGCSNGKTFDVASSATHQDTCELLR